MSSKHTLDSEIFSSGIILPEITPIPELDDPIPHNDQMNDDPSNPPIVTQPVKKGLQFRTYRPYHPDLKKLYKPTSSSDDGTGDATTDPTRSSLDTALEDYKWVTDETMNLIELSKPPEFDRFLEFDAQAKPTWDLKRDVKPKMALLEEQTQQAIKRLVQQKLLADATNALPPP